MTHIKPILTVTAIVFNAFAGPIAAQTADREAGGLVFADKPAAIAARMQSLGYRAEVTTDGVGDPKINSAAAGDTFQIYFYGCRDGRDCNSIQFYSAYDVTNGLDMSVTNAWNKDNRYATAYLDSENDPIMYMDVAMHGGLPEALFERHLAIWEDMLPRFAKHIGW